MTAYHVENFGCRASRSDGEAIAAGLRDHGLAAAEGPDAAQIVILNTCSVTAEADRTARAFIRRVRHRNPNARIVVTGCYAQRAPDEIAGLAGVNAVIGNSHKSLAPQIAVSLAKSCAGEKSFVPLSAITPWSPKTFSKISVDEAFAHVELACLPFASDSHQTRPNLKVQDGCGNRCSFCVIPTTRGPSRSVSLGTCLDHVRRFAESGGQELVLSGINLGRWGRDLTPAQNFVELVSTILRETSLPRLRLSSIEPMDWGSGLLALFGEFASGRHPRLAPHAHLPLQSGSDEVLRKMYRRYRPWHYSQRVNAIRIALPDAAIGADVMVGFPGESDTLFEESYQFIAAQPFTYLHLFPFSPRPGTPGWELHRDHPIPAPAVAERMTRLRALIARKNLEFRTRLIGTEVSAVTLVTERELADRGQTRAITENFVPIEIEDSVEPNRMLAVEVSGVTERGLFGSVRAHD